MQINEFDSLFHDGRIIDIINSNDDIIFLMKSAQVIPEWNVYNIELSKAQTINGKLHVEKVKNITVNGKQTKIIKKIYDSGEILDLEVAKNKVFVLITWINYRPKVETSISESIVIEANKIYWENIPDLLN